jgi:DNA-binding response OmpR family regulator
MNEGKEADMPCKTVVVVDDEQDLLSLLRRILEDRGYRVITAPNGRDGIETVLDQKPDLVMMDVLLPIVQGGEALRYLKGQEGLDHTKVILMSSLPPKEFDRIYANRSTADAYLQKPLAAKQVLGTIESLLAAEPL